MRGNLPKLELCWELAADSIKDTVCDMVDEWHIRSLCDHVISRRLLVATVEQ